MKSSAALQRCFITSENQNVTGVLLQPGPVTFLWIRNTHTHTHTHTKKSGNIYWI